MRNRQQYLFKYLEPIDTECKDNVNVPKFFKTECGLLKKALNLDKIKNDLGLNLSSCDYIKIRKKNNIWCIDFIEFKDIGKKKRHLEESLKFIFANENFIKKLIKSCFNTLNEKNEDEIKKYIESLKKLKSKEAKKHIKNDLKKKVLESIIIFFYLYKKFKINEKIKIPSKMEFNYNIFLCGQDARILDNLKYELKSDLKNIVNNLNIIPISKYP